MTETTVLVCVAGLASIGILIDSAERVSVRPEVERAFDWRILASCHTTSSGGLAPVWTLIGGSETGRASALWHGSRSVLALSVVACYLAGWRVPAALLSVLVLLIQVGVQARLSLGLDGADQMQVVIWLGLALSGLSAAAGLFLIAVESLLSYFIAGLAKLTGPDWRSGAAPAQIVSTIGHGSPEAHRLLAVVGVPIAFATMGFEIVGPVLALFGEILAAGFIASAIGFHAGVAWAMGLNNFVWAFCAALPAVWWLVSSF